MRALSTYCLLFLMFFSTYNSCKNAITYRLSKGRFGDQIIAYAKAKYLAKKYDLQFLYKSFAHSSLLTLDTQEPFTLAQFQRTFLDQAPILPTTNLATKSKKTILFIAQLDTKKDEIQTLDSVYDCMLTDSDFAQEIKQMLTPQVAIHKLDLPQDKITVALHVRKGSGLDRPIVSMQRYNIADYINRPERTIDKSNLYLLCADERYPHKFPPDQFYIESLKLLCDLVDNRPMYVYLFTDYANPQELVDLYTQEVNRSNIIFACHTVTQQKNMRMIDDYYNMAQFDCLIRSASNFSRASQLLGIDTIKLIIAAKHATWHDDAVVIDALHIQARNSKEETSFNFMYKIPEKNKNEFLEMKKYIQKIFCL